MTNRKQVDCSESTSGSLVVSQGGTLVVDAPTLLDGIGDIARVADLWGRFTGRIGGGAA